MCIAQSLRLGCLVLCLYGVSVGASELAMPELFAGTANPETDSPSPVPPPWVEPTRIAVNQAGYMTHAPKHAMLVYPHAATVVELVQANTGMVLKTFTAAATQQTRDGVAIQWLDFTAVQLPGQYFLRQNAVQSATFSIGEDVYESSVWLLLRSYYLQRCGVALRDSITQLAHEACHTNNAVFARSDGLNKADDPHNASGGWHDAGDYGRYMATAAVTVNRLMSLYLMQPERYRDGDLSIPESGNGKPDLLDEVAYELDWMLKMQRMDGAVYRKVSGLKWISERKPEEDTAQQYIFGISSPETGKFAASMALAARAFRDISPNDAKRYQVAAENAWAWLEKHPNMTVDWQAEDDGGSGKYLASDTDTETTLEFDDDDRLAAAIELYLTTKQKTYRDFIQKHAVDAPYHLFEWKDPSSLALWHLLMFDKSNELLSLRGVIKGRLLDHARTILTQTQQCPLRLANQRFVWGSNKMLAEEGINLLHAWYFTKDPTYYTAALHQIDFLLGRNPLALSFVSSLGAHSVKNPVHLFGSAIQRTIPGLLVGGANVLAQDNIAPKNQGVMSYVDNPRAYSVNEYAIDYNAALVGLLEMLAIYQQAMPNHAVAAILTHPTTRTD